MRSGIWRKKKVRRSTDVCTVYVGIGHDDDFMVAELIRIEFVFSESCAEGGDE
jgi:hypothetical protein